MLFLCAVRSSPDGLSARSRSIWAPSWRKVLVAARDVVGPFPVGHNISAPQFDARRGRSGRPVIRRWKRCAQSVARPAPDRPGPLPATLPTAVLLRQSRDRSLNQSSDRLASSGVWRTGRDHRTQDGLRRSREGIRILLAGHRSVPPAQSTCPFREPQRCHWFRAARPRVRSACPAYSDTCSVAILTARTSQTLVLQLATTSALASESASGSLTFRSLCEASSAAFQCLLRTGPWPVSSD